MTTSDRSFEGLLTAALHEPVTSRELERLDDRLARVLAGERPAERPRRRIRRPVLLAAAALLVVTSIVATVGAGLLNTEAPYGLMDAAAYEREVEEAKATTPLPEGVAWPAYLDAAPDPDASYGRGLGTSTVQGTAACLWYREWLAARTVDPHRAAAAVATIRDTPTWSTFADELTTDETFRALVARNAQAVLADDPGPVQEFVTNNCHGTETRS